jgi:hypothetical protein
MALTQKAAAGGGSLPGTRRHAIGEPSIRRS